MAPAKFNPSLGSFKSFPGVVSPVVTTPPRVSQQDALKHVLDHILCLSDHSGIRLSLKDEGYVKLSQVIGMPASSMSALSYRAQVAGIVTTIRLFSTEVDTLRALQGFARLQSVRLGHILTPDDWLTLTEDMFGAYYQDYAQQRFGSHVPCHGPNRNQPSFSVPIKEGSNWGVWQQRTMHTYYGGVWYSHDQHIPSAPGIARNTPKLVGFDHKPVSTVPSKHTHMAQGGHDSYLDSNMGRGHDNVVDCPVMMNGVLDHPVMMSSPKVLPALDNPAPMVQVHESYPASNMGRCHDNVDHPAMMPLPKVLPVLPDLAPQEDQFPAALLQNMMVSPNCAHGESHQDTRYIAKQDTTPCVTICNPTSDALEYTRKFGESLVQHGAKGSLAGKVHVEEGIVNKHQVCDVPTLRTSDVYSGTNNGEVIVSTTLCQYANHINIPTDDGYEIPVNMSDVTSTTRAHDQDPHVLDCDPHDVLQAPDAADATGEHSFHANLNQYGKFMDTKHVMAPVGTGVSTLEEKVLSATMNLRHMDIVEESDEPSLRDQNKPNIYKHDVVDVNVLAMATLRPAEFTQLIIDKYKFKLKGTSLTSFHLGCDLVIDRRHEEGILCLKSPVNTKNGETPPLRDTNHVPWLDVSYCQMTGIPSDHMNSGLVPLCGTHTLTVLLNITGLDLWTIDVNYAHLANGNGEVRCALPVTRTGDKREHTLAKQKTKGSFKSAGLKWLGHIFGFLHENKPTTFKSKAGDKEHVLTMQKTVDSFKKTGLKWLGHFFGFLHENKTATTFGPKPNAWLKPSTASYMHIVVHVDDMAVAMLRPKEFLQLLIDKYKPKLKVLFSQSSLRF